MTQNSKGNGRKTKNQICKTVSPRERETALIIINEIPKTQESIQEVCDKWNMDYERFRYVVQKKTLAQQYINAIEMQKKMNTNEMQLKLIKSFEKLVNGGEEESKQWVIDSNGNKTLKGVRTTTKQPDYRAVEKGLKAFFPAKFSDKIKSEQYWAIFISFNKFLINEGHTELAEQLQDLEKTFIIKITNE
jgi:hypothetical protein